MGKKYNIIYADPPWQYNDKLNHTGYNIEYKTMSTDEICKLPIKKISDKNCILFLWVTFPFLDDGLQVLKYWGFKYKTVSFVWVKANKRYNENQICFIEGIDEYIGLGHYTCPNAEICIIGLKGKIKRVSNKVRQIIYSPIKSHSEKPKEARERIIKLVGDLPRIELFAREKFEGWDVFGNEVDSDVDLNKVVM